MLHQTRTRRKLTRREQRDLDIEIGFMEGVVRRDPDCAEAWRALTEDYLRRSRQEEALQAAQILARLHPEDPNVLYNLACGYALTRQIEPSLEAIGRAISMGFSDFKWLLKDPDLGNLRKDPSFKKVWGKLGSLKMA